MNCERAISRKNRLKKNLNWLNSTTGTKVRILYFWLFILFPVNECGNLLPPKLSTRTFSFKSTLKARCSIPRLRRRFDKVWRSRTFSFSSSMRVRRRSEYLFRCIIGVWFFNFCKSQLELAYPVGRPLRVGPSYLPCPHFAWWSEWAARRVNCWPSFFFFMNSIDSWCPW